MESTERMGRSPVMGDEVLNEREVQGIFGLRQRGWHVKAIARELGFTRNTVRRWLRLGERAPRPEMGRPRLLEAHEGWVRERYLAGVRNGDVLRQELAEHGIEVSLRTVERCIKPIREEAINLDRASVRFETEPGKQMQIDFGEKWVDIAGERAKAFVFVATLGYSRRSFVRVFPGLRQCHWLAGLDEALRYFGGVAEECLVDNARALVLRWEGDRPIFHPEFDAFCRHWGMKPRACRPYRARTKGKVERSVGYGKSNGLGRLSFVSWEALDAHLVWWMREVADVRIHGTTHQRPIDRFARETDELRPIREHPAYLHVRRFDRKVTGDCRIEQGVVLTEGYQGFKVKVGHHKALDAEIVRAVVDAARGAYVWPDANQGYTLEEALRMARAFERCGVTLFEQPVAMSDVYAMRKLLSACGLTVALDEAAMEAVRTWRFEPAKRDGVPVRAWAVVPIEFKLIN